MNKMANNNSIVKGSVDVIMKVWKISSRLFILISARKLPPMINDKPIFLVLFDK
jgi:hypothetical protein